MAYHFHLADYPDSLIQSSFERAYLQERDLLLEPKPDKIDSDQDRLFLITTHHPTYRHVNNIVNKNMELFNKSSSTRPILHTDLVQGFRRCKNLRDILVQAKLKPVNNHGNVPNSISTTNKCGRPFCIYCSKFDPRSPKRHT